MYNNIEDETEEHLTYTYIIGWIFIILFILFIFIYYNPFIEIARAHTF